MSDSDPKTTLSALSSLGNSLVASLPPAFLALCLINVVFIGTIAWFESKQTEHRNEFATKMLNACFENHKLEGR